MQQVRHLYVVLSEAAGAETEAGQRDRCRERNSTGFGRRTQATLHFLTQFYFLILV